ncbi:MAG: hypothetical protein EHM70_01695 [Chloroflexota bacterium]|nr:MAG: hypothetical protein EHM70_01695 [Chloroflexota bacterium]
MTWIAAALGITSILAEIVLVFIGIACLVLPLPAIGMVLAILSARKDTNKILAIAAIVLNGLPLLFALANLALIILGAGIMAIAPN